MLEFTNITYPKNNPILHNITSRILPSKMTAIIGPSGCGKTTLLKILSGRNTSKHLGTINKSHTLVTKSILRKTSAYVHQDEILSEHLTVQETITFYEELLDTKCKDYIGLEKILSQIVGSPSNGISAGERKRLGILVCLLEKKDIIFLDEPTSGLDILNALNLIRILKEIDKTTVCVIHQPSSELFFEFDDVIVMMNGCVLYEGSPKQIFQWFVELGLNCPKYTNPADYIFTDVLPLIETKYPLCLYLDGSPKFESVNISEIEFMSTKTVKNIKVKRSYFFKEFKILLARNFKISIRNKSRFFGRWAQSMFTASIVSLIYYNTYSTEDSQRIQNIQGLLFFITNTSFFTAAMSSLPDLFDSKKLLQREYQNKYYSYSSHFFSKSLLDVVISSMHPLICIPVIFLILGYNNDAYNFFITLMTATLTSVLGYATALFVSSICSTLLLSTVILPSILLPLTILNGFIVDTNSLLFFMKPIQYVSPTRYTLFILVRNEIGLPILKQLGLKNFTEFGMGIYHAMMVIVGMIVFLMVISFVCLKIKIKRRI